MFFRKNLKLPRELLALLLVVCAANGYAQQGTISLGRRTMNAGEAMRAVESQTDYKFSYNRNIYDTAKVVNLEQTSVPLRVLLDSMLSGANVKYMVHRRYIAFVHSADNSRPQVRRSAPPRTVDVYARTNPHDLDDLGSTALNRPAVAQSVAQDSVPVLLPVFAPEPEEIQYSDYRPVDLYGQTQTTLPRFAMKIDLLYGIATLTPNFSAEVALSGRSSIELSYSNNPWKYKADLGDNRKFLHGALSLGYRHYFCERFNGHFAGVRALYSEYNISGHNVPALFKKDYRYKGNSYGGGVFYGYALPMARKWNIEFKLGVDVLGMDYDRFGCRTCDLPGQHFRKVVAAPAAGVNIVYLIK